MPEHFMNPVDYRRADDRFTLDDVIDISKRRLIRSPWQYEQMIPDELGFFALTLFNGSRYETVYTWTEFEQLMSGQLPLPLLLEAGL